MSKIKFPPLENVNQYRQCLLQSLTKLGDQSTIKTAHDEVNELMQEHTTNTERMNILVYHITEFNDSMKPFQRKELVKLLGKVAEIFEDKIIQFLPKILAFYGKRIKDADQSMHVALADTMGLLVHHLFRNIEDQQILIEQIGQVFKQVYFSLVQSNKVQQQCAANCLAKVIQNAPVDLLKKILPKVCSKMNEFFNNNSIKCKTQLFEILISIILAVEKDFQQQAPLFLPHILTEMQNPDFNTRKVCVDVIYTLTKMIPLALKPYKRDLHETLNELRFDKIKPVRESTVEALNAIKEVPELEMSEQDLKKDSTKGTPKESKKEEKKQEQRKARTIQNVEEGKQQKEHLQDQDKATQEAKELAERKVSTATQKRRETKQNQKPQVKKEKKEHQSIFKNQINQEFLQAFGAIDKGIEILAPDGEKIIVRDTVENDFGVSPLMTAKNDDEVDREMTNDNVFPQMTTIQNVDYNEDGTVLLTEEQRIHFQYKKGDKNDRDSNNSEIIEDFEEEQVDTNQSRISQKLVEKKPIIPYPTQPLQQQPQQMMRPEFPKMFDRDIAPPALSPQQQQSLNYIFFEIEKISGQQMRMMDSMSTFQNYARNELGGLRQRVHQTEQRVQQCYLMRNMKYPGAQASYEYPQTFDRPGRTSMPMMQSPNMGNLSMQSPKRESIVFQASNAQSDWDKISQLLSQNRLQEAYSLAISKSDDLLLIKLMGKTGICLEQLLKGERGRSVVEYLVQRVISILTTKEFVHVLLPWITELSDIFVDYKEQSGFSDIISQTIVSDLIEVLIGLMNDVKSGIDPIQKNEIHRIYDNLSQAFKV